MSGPAMLDTPNTAPKRPVHFPRSRGGTTSPIAAWADTMSPPPPRPWIARKAISSLMPCASPHSAEPMRKIVSAAWSTRLRPYRSPSLPYSGVTTVTARRYAVTTQERCCRPPSSPTIVGSAVETIVWSSDASSMTSMSPLTTRRIERRSAGRSGSSSAVAAATELMILHTYPWRFAGTARGRATALAGPAVARRPQRGDGVVEPLGAHEHVVGVERRHREDRDAGAGERLEQRDEHAGEGEVERAFDGQRAPAALGAHVLRHRVRGAHDGQLGRRADDGVQRGTGPGVRRRPLRHGRVAVEPRERELAGEDAEGVRAQRSRTPCFQCVSGRACSSPSTVSVTASRSLKKHTACSIFGHSGHGAT